VKVYHSVGFPDTRKNNIKSIGAVFLATPAFEPIILAMAVSGNGLGPRGETRTEGLLPMAVWANKVKEVAALLKIPLGSPCYDSAHCYRTLSAADRVGNFEAAHVEKKLAVYAIYRVLHSVTKLRWKRLLRRRLTITDLDKVRSYRLKDGQRPCFVIALRPPTRRQDVCVRCASFVRKVEKATGVRIILQVLELTCSELVIPTRQFTLPDLPEASDPEGGSNDASEDSSNDELELVDQEMPYPDAPGQELAAEQQTAEPMMLEASPALLSETQDPKTEPNDEISSTVHLRAVDKQLGPRRATHEDDVRRGFIPTAAERVRTFANLLAPYRFKQNR
jgi:hypothetical protein